MEINRVYIPTPIKLVIAEVWDYLTDDSVEDVDEWSPRIDDTSRWYIVSDDSRIVGAFWLRRVNLVTWEAHANVRPRWWGDKRGTAYCQLAIDTMFEDSGAEKIIALIPDSSEPVQRMAEAIGFTREGVQRKSWMKNGRLYDQVHFGISRK